ncbi:MAG: cation diffusion facilitator family transporter, partial [Anaerovoracaceae bacterium]
MNEFLCKKFIKDFQNTKDPIVRENYGKFAGIMGIISNVFLCVSKIVIGVLVNSIAIIADGINNLADASSSIITLVGFKLSAMPEDEEHPYGHARIEYITGIIVSIMIIVVGVELLKTSVGKVLHPTELVFSWVVVGVLIFAIGVKIWQSKFYIHLGKKINSITLTATGTDSRNDVIATAVVVISLLIGKFADLQIDGYMGCFVALFIIWSGVQLVRETMSPLLGEAPDPELVNQISDMAMSFDGVLGIHDLVVHNYGPGKTFASIHIEVDADGDLLTTHDTIDNIERKITNQLKVIITAHLDPLKLNDPIRENLLKVVTETVENIDGVYGVHDLRVVPGPTHTNVIFDVLIDSSCPITQKEVCHLIQKAIRKEEPTFYVVINFDKS